MASLPFLGRSQSARVWYASQQPRLCFARGISRAYLEKGADVSAADKKLSPSGLWASAGTARNVARRLPTFARTNAVGSVEEVTRRPSPSNRKFVNTGLVDVYFERPVVFLTGNGGCGVG